MTITTNIDVRVSWPWIYTQGMPCSVSQGCHLFRSILCAAQLVWLAAALAWWGLGVWKKVDQSSSRSSSFQTNQTLSSISTNQTLSSISQCILLAGSLADRKRWCSWQCGWHQGQVGWEATGGFRNYSRLEGWGNQLILFLGDIHTDLNLLHFC